MSKGGQGAAAANILLLKKSEESRRQETVLRDAIKVIFHRLIIPICILYQFWKIIMNMNNKEI